MMFISDRRSTSRVTYTVVVLVGLAGSMSLDEEACATILRIV